MTIYSIYVPLKTVCFCNFNVMFKGNKIVINFHLNLYSYSGGKFSIMITKLVLYCFLFKISASSNVLVIVDVNSFFTLTFFNLKN